MHLKNSKVKKYSTFGLKKCYFRFSSNLVRGKNTSFENPNMRQRSTEGTIFGRSRSRSRSHKTFGFWPKAEAVAEGTNYDRIRRNQLQK